MELITSLSGFVRYILIAFIMYGGFILIERLRPVEPHQPLKDIFFNLRWYVLYSLVNVLMQTVGINKVIGWLLHYPFGNGWDSNI